MYNSSYCRVTSVYSSYCQVTMYYISYCQVTCKIAATVRSHIIAAPVMSQCIIAAIVRSHVL